MRMKRQILIILSALLCIALLAGCSCQHEWREATCTDPRHCSKCEAVEGEALGHTWTDADCENPKTCSRCGLTEGAASGHNWTEATCTTPKICSRCSASEGQPLEHSWVGEATLYTAPVCSVCGAEGDPLPGYLARNGLSPNTRPELAADYITSTYIRPDLETTGMFLSSEVKIFSSDTKHRARNGYEWRSMDITITFNDNHSNLYGADVTCARADYYQDQELKQAGKQERFTVTFHDKQYPCIAMYENIGFSYEDNSNVFRLTCYVQVPVGYDGVVLAFLHGSIDVDGTHLHEANDPNMLLCRLA